MGWLGYGSHRGQGCQAWTAVGLPLRYRGTNRQARRTDRRKPGALVHSMSVFIVVAFYVRRRRSLGRCCTVGTPAHVMNTTYLEMVVMTMTSATSQHCLHLSIAHRSLIDDSGLIIYTSLHNRTSVDNMSTLGMWRSQPVYASVRCGFHVQNPLDTDADLLRDQNYQLLWLL